ncbi:MAG TPA: tetratricopeptide repeat protein, partial [Thermoanaerobaculia bacterium]|nr:tetratricopeptide repeat protein [Thermoanaerobaculia bacterium]
PVATLTRVCAHLQAPARELVPATPEPFSALIDALLEKDPGRRPRSAGEALARIEAGTGTAAADSEPTVSIAHRPPHPSPAAVGVAPAAARRASFPTWRGWHARRLPAILALALLGLVVALGPFLAGRLRAPRPPLYVAVARPEIGLGAGREEVALAGAALQAAALRTLASLAGVAALSPGPPEPGEPRPTVGRLSRLLAADEVVTASLDCQAHHCLAALRRQRGSDGTLLGSTASFEVPLGDLRLLATAAATYLKPLYAGFPARPEAGEVQVSTADYQRYLRALRQWQQERPADLRPLLAELERVQAGSPRFPDAYLLAASLVERRFFQTRDPGDLDHALGLVARARNLAPADPLPLVTLFDIDLNAGRLAEAAAALHELERRQPGDAVTLQRRALLSEQRGDRGQALILLRSAAERHPAGSVLMDLANLEMRLGEIPAARSTLENLLRRLPGDPGGETLLAQLELEAGSPARAAALYAGLAGRRPGFAVLSNLGLSLLLLGRHGEAEASLARAYSLAPGSYAAALNLADVELLLGRRTAASSLYERVLDLVSRDPAPGAWQALAARAQAEAHLGHKTEAADAIQRAVAAAPDNPDAAFDAALVYCVIGETASARASADRALSRGYGRRWFSLPWFDPLRQDPAFRQQVGEPSTGPIAGETLPANSAGRPPVR